MSITIKDDNEVVVRSPKHIAADRLQKIINEKTEWIEKNIARNNIRALKNESVLDYKEIYVCGNRRLLDINAPYDEISPVTVYVKSLSHLKNLFIKAFSGEFLNRVSEISQVIGLQPASVSFKNYKSRWGCCDAENNLVFNYKVFMLPRTLQDYIIVHEICHIRHHNHSRAFWSLANRYADCKRANKEIKDYDFLTRLY